MKSPPINRKATNTNEETEKEIGKGYNNTKHNKNSNEETVPRTNPVRGMPCRDKPTPATAARNAYPTIGMEKSWYITCQGY